MDTSDIADATAEAVYWRGQFIHRHAGVEFALSELLIRARLLDEYAEIGDLPFVWRRRVKLLERMLSLPGRLAAYQEKLLSPLREIDELEDYRHLLVHGLMVVDRPITPDRLVRFRMFGWPQKGALGLVALDLPMKQLIDLAQRVAPLSSAMTGLVADLCRSIPLPLAQADAQQPLIPESSA
jgi:hypothetical protein